MKKTYICPSISIEEAQATQMLAESLGMYNDTTVPGGNALTKEDDDWDIWSNDGEE